MDLISILKHNLLCCVPTVFSWPSLGILPFTFCTFLAITIEIFYCRYGIRTQIFILLKLNLHLPMPPREFNIRALPSTNMFDSKSLFVLRPTADVPSNYLSCSGHLANLLLGYTSLVYLWGTFWGAPLV